MKQTKAYNLESDAIAIIEKYKADKELKTASSALERILLTELPKQLEYEDLKNELKELKDLIRNLRVVAPADEVTIDEEIKEEVEHFNIKKSFKDSFANMPD